MTSVKDRLLAAAASNFYERGVTATGIDAITAAAGVAKQSLYNNFSSKSDLVLAYIEARHGDWLDLFRRRSAQAHGPDERVLAVFDAYIDHASAPSSGGFRGCGLLNAAAEFPVGDPARDAVRRHKEEVEDLLREALAARPDATNTTALAEHLSFLLEGAVARAGLEGTTARLEHARTVAAGILAAQ